MNRVQLLPNGANMRKDVIKLLAVLGATASLIYAVGETKDEDWLTLWFLLLIFVAVPLALLALRDVVLSFFSIRGESRRFWFLLHVCAAFAAVVGYLLGIMAAHSGHPRAELQRWLVVLLPLLVYLFPVLLWLHSLPRQLALRVWRNIRAQGQKH